MYSVTFQDMTIHYDRMGSGEPLVLIHGLGERKEGWAGQHALADAFDLIIPDLRGHGESMQAEGISAAEISMEAFARDILRLLDELGVESAHICGLSMGGVVAQELYRLAPERFRSLILVNTFFYVPRLLRLPLYQSWMWRAQCLPPVWRWSFAAATCLADWRSETVQRFCLALNPNHKTYRQTLEACLGVDNSRLLPEIQVPTLIIGSEYDLLTPLWIQVMMHHLIKGSQLAILRRAGHMSKLERPEEFNRVVREFLERQKDGKASA